MSNSTIHWRSLIKELFIVTAGVLIALVANSWYEKQNEIRQAGQFLTGIYEEIEDNITVLRETLPYHKKLLKDLREDPLKANLSLNPAHVRNVAWKLAENSVFKENTDNSLYYELSNAYDMHDYLVNTQMDAAAKMSELNILGPFYLLQAGTMSEVQKTAFQVEASKGWIPIFETWIFFEQSYLQALEEIIDKSESGANHN
ncbi:MAG: hypothetical protein KTR24_15995 [Saprospiraceae bacterium]|nr:hypothetical protein [Saprospiraceae bacterium]